MRHCCEFDAKDIWYLKDTDQYTSRTLFIGICPICSKQVCVLSQRKIKTNSYMNIKKVGELSSAFLLELAPDKLYSKLEINKMKFKSKPFGWRYGLNKQRIKKDGSYVIKQYSVDFDRNAELIKKYNSFK